jgi:hypothetical protein
VIDGALDELLNPETRHGVNQHTGGVDKLSNPKAERFTADAAAKTGKDERTIRRAARRGEGALDVSAGALDHRAQLRADQFHRPDLPLAPRAGNRQPQAARPIPTIRARLIPPTAARVSPLALSVEHHGATVDGAILAEQCPMHLDVRLIACRGARR